ncbi:Minor extracellular protease vpr [Apiospora rasikravindrae]|uniref:Minor extracellular protease vpr n=1 Tax=Apiospora rasikravindrae TaxID=990691 RepID=A0ABR1U8A7_9PEZI
MRPLNLNAITGLVVSAAIAVDTALAQAARPNEYIVEYATGAGHALRARDSLASKGDIRVRKSFEHAVFSGASIETETFDFDGLGALPEVARVWRNNVVTLDPMARQAEKVEAYKALDYAVHNSTGVAELHAAGVLGEGALVGIVDTGVWWKHPALGGCIGPECKVTGGHDFVGDIHWRPGLEKHPDEDPMDNAGHGTHVAGIVAGENEYWSGVAPRSKIRMYKVFSDAHGLDSDDATVIEGFLMAAEDGVDIITCSIGSFNGWPHNAWAVVADRLVDDGIFVSISAGNEGSAGPFFGSTGASGKNVLTVASIASDKRPVRAGGNVAAHFANDSGIPSFVDWAAGGKASGFTTWGAENDLTVKPDVGAPGGSIYSTYLDNSYSVQSGTSMACPYIAGVAALWVSQFGGRAAHGKGWARALGRRIISSGRPLPWYDGAHTYDNFTAPVEQVGTGLVDAWKVLHYDTQLEFDTMGLNDTRHFNRHHQVELTNNGQADIVYTFSHAPAAGFETYECTTAADDCRIKPWKKFKAVQLDAVVTRLPEPFALEPGESKVVEVRFDNPDKLGWNAAALPAYSGHIRIEGSNGEELSVPYFGLGADLQEVIGPIFRKGYPVAVAGADNATIVDNSSCSFDFNEEALGFPRITARLKWGSAQIRWDIFEEDWTEREWTWPLKVGENGYVGAVHGIDKSTGSADYPNVTVTFPVAWAHRNADGSELQRFHEYWWPEGKLGGGEKIKPGNYTMRFAALNPFGVPENGTQWSVFKTPKITVL